MKSRALKEALHEEFQADLEVDDQLRNIRRLLTRMNDAKSSSSKKLTRPATEWKWRQIKRRLKAKSKEWINITLKLGFMHNLKIVPKFTKLPKLARFKIQKRLTAKSELSQRSKPPSAPLPNTHKNTTATAREIDYGTFHAKFENFEKP